MLIHRAELDYGTRICDVRLDADRISEVAARLAPEPGETVYDAEGAALIPGLHDHHLHLYATAAAQASVRCGPPRVASPQALEQVLRTADATLEVGTWLRGVGFHESVMQGGDTELNRDWLDRVLPTRPARIQHRSGRLWVLNSVALKALGVDHETPSGSDPLERITGRLTGRLYDADDWLRARLEGVRPSLAGISRQLLRCGVTGVTDASYNNGLDNLRALSAAQTRGELLQEVRVMGNAELDAVNPQEESVRLQRGARKFHLHEHALPEFDAFCNEIRTAHGAARNVAFHCVTRAELVFALAGLREAGVRAGDRIEHAAVTPPELLAEIAALQLIVVTQPGFIAERGDTYRHEVEARDLPWLYRLRSFIDAGIPMASSSDAPYTDINPWRGMAAAVSRQTAGGEIIGSAESLSPEQALASWLASLADPAGQARRIAPGLAADLCLLPDAWKIVRTDLAAAQPRCVWQRGKLTEVGRLWSW